MAKMGQAEEGILEIQKGLSDWLVTGTRFRGSYYHFLLADAFRTAGEVEQGLDVISSTIKNYEKSVSVRFGSSLHRLKGELLAKQDRFQAEAEAEFRRALDMAHRQKAKFDELQASKGLARLWQMQGKKDEAREILANIYGCFTEGFDTPNLKEARELLEELS